MKKTTLLEILDAAHLTKMVQSPFEQRGGMMLVGPPASLKSTLIKSAIDEHYDALVVSDLNIQTLVKLRDDLRSGRYGTIAFLEFEKLYARRADTSSNIEATLKQLVEEGFHRASFEDQRMASTASRCLVVGAMTSNFYENHFSQWNNDGFLRRFLWCHYTVTNAHLLMDAIADWQPLDLGTYSSKNPGNKFIPYKVNDTENNLIRKWLKDQPGQQTPFVLMKKILSVLHWKYDKESSKKALRIMEDFAQCLRSDGAQMELDNETVGA